MVKGKGRKRRIAYIERLPDCLLLHILSFLCTYDAIQTSVLSKRWKNLWKSVPCLDLDDLYFDDNETFQNFVNRVLILHKASHLDKFHFCWFGCDMHRQHMIDTWLRRVSELSPRDLEVKADGVNLVQFPLYLLSCVTMERLCLFIRVSERLEIFPKTVKLPFLKSLSLKEVVIHEGFMNGLISACPILEELHLVGCSFETPKIVSQTLKELTISGSYAKLLSVCAPNLDSLNCEAPPGLVSFGSMPCLYKASITFDEDELGCEFDENVVTWLHNLANARLLCLFGDYVKKMLEKESQNCSTFRNLESLALGGFSISRNLQPIASFLRLTPNLVNLTFCRISITFCASTGEEEAVQEIQCCHLKTLEIIGDKSDSKECDELANLVAKNLDKAAEPIVTIQYTRDLLIYRLDLCCFIPT